MANTYIAVSVQDNGKNYAYAIKVTDNDNLLCKLAIKGILYANICETKKKACETVDCWNHAYIQNNTYIFSESF